MTEIHTPTHDEIYTQQKESSVEIQYSVLGLITDSQGRLLLLNQVNKDEDTALQSPRAWRTPGGRVEMPPELRYPLGGQLRATPIPKERINDFARYVHPHDVEDYMDHAERSLSETYLMSECQRELVEEINELIREVLLTNRINLSEITADDPRYVSNKDVEIEAGTRWHSRKADLKPGDKNTNRKYFKVKLSPDAQRKVEELVTNGKAIWFDQNHASNESIIVSKGAVRSLRVATRGTFTDLSKPKE